MPFNIDEERYPLPDDIKKKALSSALMQFGLSLLQPSQFKKGRIGGALQSGFSELDNYLGGYQKAMQGRTDEDYKKALMQNLLNPPVKPASLGDQVKAAEFGQEQEAGDVLRRLNIAQPYGEPAQEGIQGLLNELLSKSESKYKAYQSANKPEEAKNTQTSDIKEYEYAKQQGFKGSLADYIRSMKAAGRSVTNVNIPGQEKSFDKKFGEIEAERIGKFRTDADDALLTDEVLREAESKLNKGIYSGMGANLKLGFDKLLQAGTIKVGGEKAANTEAYAGLMGRMVGKVIKQFGSGTGLSDADREYAQKIAGGDITLTETSMRKLIDINKRLNRFTVKQYNKAVKSVKASKGTGDLLQEIPEYGDTQAPGTKTNKPDPLGIR